MHTKIMPTFTLPLFALLLLFSTTTTAQPYKATDHFLLNCGTSATSTTNPRWDGDEASKFVNSNITTTSFSSTIDKTDQSVPRIPYYSARIFNASFTYRFPVSQGPKFLRLYFYPATYSGLNPEQSFFSVSSNGYSLLSNFSALLTSSYLAKIRDDAGLNGPPVPHFVKEFMIYVKDTQLLNVSFTPSPNSFAFINGIEVVSLPENLYFNANKKQKYVGMITRHVINNDTALENIYRLNMGGSQISGNGDTGMFRSWDQDDSYIFPPSAIGLTPLNKTPITYTTETPNYTAPDQVYGTQRSMGLQSESYNLTWRLPVDSGFYYMLRLHFCNIIPQYTRVGQTVFKIFINNQTVEEAADLFHWTPGTGYPVFKDYAVHVNDPDGRRSKQDLWLALHPNSKSDEYSDAYLNGLEVFKFSMQGNLAGPNPEPSHQMPKSPSPPVKNTKKTPPYPLIIGGVVGGLVFLSLLVLILFWQRRIKLFGACNKSSLSKSFNESESTKSCKPSLPTERCRHFSLMELKVATNDFNDYCIIGRGGFGTVYKGYIDNATTNVAIKRLNSSSKQGFHEFQTEIGMLSKLRHVQLVSLIGYCDDESEMILVYDYMTHGTLHKHLHNKNNPPLSWKRRLHICIGAAKGLNYLHTGANRVIIHRDVKSTNILLDENWVAKVSDFGLSKLGPRDKAQNHVSTVVKGTIGYIDPQYYKMSQLTEKSDVYSFGVILFEVLCARPVMNLALPSEEVNLVHWGKLHWQNGTLHEIIDVNIRGEIEPTCLVKFGEVAESCLKEEGSERPVMEDVVWGLEFALQLQEDAEKTGDVVGEAVLEDQKLSFLMQKEPNITEDYALWGSINYGSSSTDSHQLDAQPTG